MAIPKRIQERRRAVRIEESVPVKIGHENFELAVKSVNISTSGALCLVDQDIPLMTQLRVGVSIPAGYGGHSKPTLIHAKGVVVRKEKDPISDKYQLAIFFSDLKAADQALLKEFVERRLAA